MLFLINSLVAIFLLVTFLFPFVSPKSVPQLAVLSLLVPILIILNFLFLIYWLIKLKKQFMLSGVILLLGWFALPPIYKISNNKLMLNDDIKIMSFNIRMFNHYKWNKDHLLGKKAVDFINDNSPDILVFQEYFDPPKEHISYLYKYIKTKSEKSKFGMAIYSKFPIVGSGSFDLEDSSNNIIYADVVCRKDTVRIYNLHLESLGINPRKENFGEKDSKKLFGRLQQTFKKQAVQVEQFLAHEKLFKGKKIICGDFNNTAFSWVYHQVKNNKKDAFIEAGNGFGKSFDYPFPMRIDFILVDNTIAVNNFTTFDKKFSDHFPIMARINLNDNQD